MLSKIYIAIIAISGLTMIVQLIRLAFATKAKKTAHKALD